MKLNDLNKIAALYNDTETMPLLFIGHGNPINAITQNEYTVEWNKIGKSLPGPNAVICISAHWETNGTFVTTMDKPRTIHDFYGFPAELFEVEYKAPGSPYLARETKKLIAKTSVELDNNWGLDHGCWSVVMHLFPEANIPVIELSLDYTKQPQWHYELGKELSFLRNKGILIIGSGNIVHNLRMISWQNKDGFDWALEADRKFKKLILNDEYTELIDYKNLGIEVQLAVPTPEHFLPLLYILGLKEKNESISFFNEKTELGSISMTSLMINRK
ncbi:MAG: 4,5-DOPA dioxygenase extradiol [Ignavibacteriaceae bacterium]